VRAASVPCGCGVVLSHPVVACSDAERSNAARTVDPSTSKCLFAQMYAKLCEKPDAIFRYKLDETRGVLFNIKYQGEEGLDYGGLYRWVLAYAKRTPSNA
jgi:hypothetical protein